MFLLATHFVWALDLGWVTQLQCPVQPRCSRLQRYCIALDIPSDFLFPERALIDASQLAVRLFEDKDRLAMFSVVEIDRELPGSREDRCARRGARRSQECREAGEKSKARELHMCEYTSIARISVLGFDRWDW